MKSLAQSVLCDFFGRTRGGELAPIPLAAQGLHFCGKRDGEVLKKPLSDEATPDENLEGAESFQNLRAYFLGFMVYKLPFAASLDLLHRLRPEVIGVRAYIVQQDFEPLLDAHASGVSFYDGLGRKVDVGAHEYVHACRLGISRRRNAQAYPFLSK